MKSSESHSVFSDCTVHGILQARTLERVAFPFLLQGISPTQKLTWCFLHGRRILYQLSYEGSPNFREGSKATILQLKKIKSVRKEVGWTDGDLVEISPRSPSPEVTCGLYPPGRYPVSRTLASAQTCPLLLPRHPAPPVPTLFSSELTGAPPSIRSS